MSWPLCAGEVDLREVIRGELTVHSPLVFEKTDFPLQYKVRIGARLGNGADEPCRCSELERLRQLPFHGLASHRQSRSPKPVRVWV